MAASVSRECAFNAFDILKAVLMVSLENLNGTCAKGRRGEKHILAPAPKAGWCQACFSEAPPLLL
jgi:hypothetical protein